MPLYQGSTMLTPKVIMQQVRRGIMKFFYGKEGKLTTIDSIWSTRVQERNKR